MEFEVGGGAVVVGRGSLVVERGGRVGLSFTLMCRVEEKRAAHRMHGFNKTKMCCNFPQLNISGLVTLKYSILK